MTVEVAFFLWNILLVSSLLKIILIIVIQLKLLNPYADSASQSSKGCVLVQWLLR